MTELASTILSMLSAACMVFACYTHGPGRDQWLASAMRFIADEWGPSDDNPGMAARSHRRLVWVYFGLGVLFAGAAFAVNAATW